MFENEVLGNLRETVGRLDDAASKPGAVGQRAARDMAGNEPPGENIGKAGLDRFKEQAKQAGLDPDELLAAHDEYQDLLDRFAKYKGPQIDQMLLDGVPADKVAESLGIPASIVQRRESGLIPPAEQATEAPKKPTKSLAEMVVETRKRLGKKTGGTSDEGTGTDDTGGDGSGGTGTGGSDRPQISSVGVQGTKGTLNTADGAEREVQYFAVEDGYITPSHDARRNFARNEGGDENERPYHDQAQGETSRMVVWDIAKAKPGKLLHLTTDTPSPIDGPPMTTPEGIVLGGNARAMGIQLAYHNGGEAAARMKQAMVDAASKLGIDPAVVAKMERPVIIRVLTNPGDRGELSRILNESLAAGRTQAVSAASAGKKISVHTAEVISYYIEPDATGEAPSLRNVMADANKAVEIIKMLVRDGAMTKSEVERFVDPKTQRLNDEGKIYIEQALLGRVVPDPTLIGNMAAGVKKKVLAALGPLTRGVTDSKYGPRIAEVIQNAVAAFNGYKGSKSPIVRYFFGQQTFVPFPGQGDPSVAGVVLAMDEMGIRKFRAGWANVVDSLDIGSGAEQVKLFATVEKTDSVDTAVQREFPLPSGWRKLGEKKEPTKEDKPDTQGKKKKSLDEVSVDDLLGDMEGNLLPSGGAAETEKKIGSKKKSEAKKPGGKKTTPLGKSAKKSTADLSESVKKFWDAVNKTGIVWSPERELEIQKAALRLVADAIKAGVLNFASMVEQLAQDASLEILEKLGPLIEKAWTTIYDKYGFEGMTPAGNVAEILKELKNEKEEETDEGEESDAGADDDVGGPGDAGDDRADGEGRLKTVRESTGRPPDTSVVDQSLVPHLRPHQVVGVASAIRAMDDQSDPDAKGGFLLADGTGAGKTRQILAVAQHYANRGFKVLLVAPSAVLGGPFSKRVPEISGSYADDAKAMGIEFNLIKKATRGTLSGGVNITTYEYLKNVEAAVDKDVVLLFDEAHALKNYSASHPKHRAARGIRMIKAARSVLLATATPADKPSHLAYLVRTGMLEGESYENQMRELGFKLVRRPSASFWTIDESVGAEEVYRRMDELFARVAEAGGMLKRELSMKGVNIDFETVELPAECYSLMQRIQDEFTDNGKKELNGKDKAIVRMHQRRQQEPFKIARAVEMAKEELAEGRRVIIYASRVNKSDVVKRTYARDRLTGERYLVEERLIHSSEGTLRTLKKKLEEAGITDISELHGGAESTSAEAQEKFQSGKARVLIATIESGGVGINLDDRAGDSPRTMIIMTAPFSAVENVQAAGRVWRMTSKSKPKIRFLFGDTGVDRWNRDIIASKMQTLDAVVSGDVGRLDVENAEWRQIQDVENLGLGGINELASQLMRGWSKEEVDNTVSLIKARAEKQGMSPDAWVAKQIAGVEIAESEAAARSYGGQQLHQRNLSQAQGMVEFLDDGRAVIRGFNGKNVSTLVHELGHIFRRDLTPEELKTAEQWAGVQGGRWTLGMEEKFARAFERWLREGKTTNPKLVSIFQKFKEWLTAIYSKLKNSPIQVRLGPEIRSLFDTMLGGTGEAVEVSGPDAGTSGPETGYSNVRQTKSQVPRKPGDDADGIAAQDIIKTWERIFKVPIRAGGFFAPRKGGQGKVGIYKFWPEIARIAEDYIGSLAVAMHEIAHHIDNTNKLFQPGSGAPLNVPQAEANEVAGLDYDKDKARTFEGFAEYLRMWITEPEINVGGQMKS
ncbi:MAG: DEAD/DEAH box helicase family protein, partial [Clostridiaceae bacterium]|nr:DEAD/DEAH box helicase family protein [Clostridiaceae bacterium]